MKIIHLQTHGYAEVVDKAVEIIKNGGVVVIPTDTVYGFAAYAGNEHAVKKVFEIKGRTEDKKLPVFVSSFKMLRKIINSGHSGQSVFEFLKKIWPGKITCVLPLRLRQGFGGQRKEGETIGVRMPNHGLVLEIIEKLGGPITGTSANIAGTTEHTKIKELIEEFKNRKVCPDLIIDAGDLPPSKPSTVLDCVVWPPKILRSGAISEEELKKLLAGYILK